MLHFIRDRAHGWLAWFIVSLIIIPFALWGVHQYLGGGKEIPAATVNGANISQQQVHENYLRQRERLRQMLGKNFRPEMFNEQQMKVRIVQDLIKRELLVQTAVNSGMRISDGLLASTIRSIDAFKQNGQFSSDAYEAALQRQGMLPGMFESQVRRDMVVSQLRSGVADSSFVTDWQLKEYLRLSRQQRDVGYLILPVTDFTKAVEVSDVEAADYYDHHPERFSRPQEVKVRYLELSAKTIAEGIKVGDDEVHTRYEAQLANYRTPEERRARHILISVPDGDDKAQQEAALSKAKELLQKLRNGADFAKLAEENSDDPGSAKQGGDLGFFTKGTMDPAFDAAVFSLKKGELSEPVKSAFGYHIIRLDDIHPSAIKPFDAVKDKVREEIRKERADEQFYDQAEKLANLTYEHPDSLDEAANTLGLTIKDSGYFSRAGGKGVLGNQKVVNAAFSNDVMVMGNNSEPVEITPDHLVVVRVADQRPEAVRPLDEVKDQIVSALRRDKAATATQSAAKALLKELEDGADPEATAKAHDSEWVRKDGVLRDDSKIKRGIVTAAFTSPRPSGDKPSWRQVSLAGGDQAVMAVFAVRDGDAKDTADSAKERTTLQQADSSAVMDAFVEGIRAGASITIPKQTVTSD